MFTLEGREQTLYSPVAALISAVCVVAICMAAPQFSLTGLRTAKWRFTLESAAVGLGLAGLAILWVHYAMERLHFPGGVEVTITDELGLGWALAPDWSVSGDL